MRDRIITVIQARMGSTRFPGKVMQDLCGKPVLQHVIEQADEINSDDLIVVTSENTENLPIINLCVEMNIDIHIMKNDLECLYWYYDAAKTYRADFVVRVCGDSPFVDYNLANLLIDKIHPEYDYFTYTIDKMPAIMTLYGIFVEIFSVEALNSVMEHVTVPFYHLFDQSLIPWVMDYPYKLSIDYPEDLYRAETIVAMNGGKIPGWKKINQIMRKRPELQYYGDINQVYKWNK